MTERMVPTWNKPDATGRSSDKVKSGKATKARKPPAKEPWVWITRDLLSSPAWRAQSINCRRLIDFLLVEHMNHAGIENGNLTAPYNATGKCRSLVDVGIRGRHRREAIDEAEALGLVAVQRGGSRRGSNQPSRFRLTFLPTVTDTGFWEEPTNEWRHITDDDVAAYHRQRKQPRNE